MTAFFTDDVFDKDGLVYSSRIAVSDGRFYCGNEEVFIAPECRGVTEYLLAYGHLWEAARVRLNRVDIRQKRAPIIGVSFSEALKKALSNQGPRQKSMFQLPDWTRYKGKAVVATLVAHTSEGSSSLEFQAWQFLDVSDETFYIHAMVDKGLSFVSHIDAATLSLTQSERDEIAVHGNKIKGQLYTKHFRLDGRISIAAAENLMNLYFPVQPLTREFLKATDMA
jgi:hypothetical protein